MDLTHHRLPQDGGGVAAGGDLDALRPVVAHPDGGGIVAGITHKPAVTVGGGGAGLARHHLSGNLGLGARAALNDLGEHLVHIPGGAGGHDGVPLPVGGVVQQDHLLTVHLLGDLGIGSGGQIDPLPGEGGVGCGHVDDPHAVGEAPQGQLGGAQVALIVSIGLPARFQGGDAEFILGELEGQLGGELLEHPHGHGVGGILHRLGHVHAAPEIPVGVHRPGAPPQHLHRVVVIDCGWGDDSQLQGGGVDRQGLDG